ncbi:MAG TPA: regulatory protein RecX [Candidatus Binatia bacterium]|nr:regulatory protein RecX [Candidatus Binatia bacterium]
MRGGDAEEVYNRALRFLAYRPRSEAELRARLARAGFSPQEIEGALAKLRGLKLLDDEAFARSFARDRIENRGYGPLRIERELRFKGVAKAVIAEVLKDSFDRERDNARARALLERRFRGQDLHDLKTARRAVAYLRRRGYRDALIAEVLKTPIED